LSPLLEQLAAEYAGRWILAKVDVDAEQQIAAAFQVQSIPSVFAVIGGQVAPLFQGALPEPQLRQAIDKVLEIAASQGIDGAVQGEEVSDDVDAELDAGDPQFDAAVEAIDAGDWPAARAAYQKILDESPADSDAAAGLAMVDPAGTASMPNSWPRTSRLCRATGRRASPASSTPFGNPRVMIASVPGPGLSNCSRSRATIQPWHLHERLWPALFSEPARLCREMRACKEMVCAAGMRQVEKRVKSATGFESRNFRQRNSPRGSTSLPHPRCTSLSMRTQRDA
jgi:hypothetical protein